MVLRTLAEMLVWLLPPLRVKNRLLGLFGHTIHPTASIMPIIAIGVRRVKVGAGCKIGLLNTFRGLRLIELDDESLIESWTWISAHPIFQTLDDQAGTLYLGFGSKIGSRCYIDCSGTVVVRSYAALGGHRCVLQTHEPDLDAAEQTVGRITIGSRSLVSSLTVMLQGAFVPPNSVVGAHSTVLAGYDETSPSGLYVGSPAKYKRELTGAWFDRDFVTMRDHRIDAQQGVLTADRVRDIRNPGAAVTPSEMAATP